jgi:hypothetical protein
MLQGQYFEYLAIGGGVGEDVTDLPRLKKGGKGIDQIRIEQQAAKTKAVLYNPKHPEYLGFKIKNTQVRLEDEQKRGVADIEAEKDGEDWIIDLKLTRSFTQVQPPYSYGHMEDMDLIQLNLYKDMYDKQFGKDCKTGILVAEKSPPLRIKNVTIELTKESMKDMEERVQTGYETIAAYNEHEWLYNPSKWECNDCPLACKARYSEKMIIQETIRY